MLSIVPCGSAKFHDSSTVCCRAQISHQLYFNIVTYLPHAHGPILIPEGLISDLRWCFWFQASGIPSNSCLYIIKYQRHRHQYGRWTLEAQTLSFSSSKRQLKRNANRLDFSQDEEGQGESTPRTVSAVSQWISDCGLWVPVLCVAVLERIVS